MISNLCARVLWVSMRELRLSLMSEVDGRYWVDSSEADCGTLGFIGEEIVVPGWKSRSSPSWLLALCILPVLLSMIVALFVMNLSTCLMKESGIV